jgi:1,6-anhydro-N-acetylmuramate kinase
MGVQITMHGSANTMAMQVPCRVHAPKYRKKVLFGQIRHGGTVFHELARRKECQIEEGHLMADHADIDPAENFFRWRR